MMHIINAIIQCILIYVDVNLNHPILHHCCFTAALFQRTKPRLLIVPLLTSRSHCSESLSDSSSLGI